MTHEDLGKTIDAINAGKSFEWVFERRLTETINLATIWLDPPEGRSCNEHGYRGYLIRNEGGECIAAVLDMNCDLHAYVKPECRRRGVMFTALMNTILPHLAQTGREFQEVTYSTPEAEALVLKLGFSIVESGKARMDLEPFLSTPPLHARVEQLSAERRTQALRHIRKASGFLKMAADEIEGTISDELLERLSNLGNRTLAIATDVSDQWRDADFEAHMGFSRKKKTERATPESL